MNILVGTKLIRDFIKVEFIEGKIMGIVMWGIKYILVILFVSVVIWLQLVEINLTNFVVIT